MGTLTVAGQASQPGANLTSVTVSGTGLTTGSALFSGSRLNFQTFYFGPEFSGLTRVEIPTIGWSLDNLVVAIPEPNAWTLLLLGAGLAGRQLVSGRRQ